MVNPDVGREYLLKEVTPAKHPKTVLVVGAGPAGLAAARMAAMHGHRVTICEQSPYPGGALRYAAMAPGRGEVADITNYLNETLELLGVDVRLNTPVDKDLAKAVAPDAVILATGSLVDIPMLRGLIQTHMEVCTVTEIYADGIEIGQKVIVWGGNQAGLVTADYLAEKGKQVVVLNRGAHFAEEMSSNDRYYLRERLKSGRVQLFKQVVVDHFTENGVKFRAGDQSMSLSGFDSVVLADPFVSVRQAANLFKNSRSAILFTGDAKRPRHVMYAISEGEEAARSL